MAAPLDTSGNARGAWTPSARLAPGRAVTGWFAGWWRVIHLGALLLVLALSPSSYAARHRPALARQVVLGTAPTLAWFTLLSAFLSVVLIRIVIVTARSYGLSQYALEMVVRVLVLELIPLAGALFVALRYSLPAGAELVGLRRRLGLDAAAMRSPAMLVGELLPRVLAGVFAVLMLAAVSCVVALVIAYVSIHGLTPWALAGYTRTVGHIFNPAVALIFSLKTLAFSATVALIPIASAVYDAPPGASRTRVELRALVRMFVLLLLVELVSLMGNYS
jgi:phospholipid/cholesterol/gamma-HCH transport system permease protein